MRLRIVKEASTEKERREAYVARHERAEGGKDALYKQSKNARYRSDIRASKSRRSTRISEIRAQKRAERRNRGRNALRGVGVVAAAAVLVLSVGRGVDGLVQDQERRDNYALDVHKKITGVDPTDETAPDATVTSTVYDTPGEAREAVEEIENGDNSGGINVVTAPVEPSDSYPGGGVEVIQIQEK